MRCAQRAKACIVEMVTDTITVLERYLAAWAAFEDALESAD